MGNGCVDTEVVSVTSFGSGDGHAEVFELVLGDPGWEWTPGQFLMARPHAWNFDPLWGRPFSIADVDGRGLKLLIQVAGRGTQLLSALRPGEGMTLWGPLGNGFAMEEDTPTLLLAGGIGLAPFMGYAKAHPMPGNLELLFGHRLPAERFPLAEAGQHVRTVAMREQSMEELTRFIAQMEAKIREYARGGLILACGPTPFLRTVRKLALALKARAQLSLENAMACGVGACLGCVVNNHEGWPVKVCTAGPVFWAQDITLPEPKASDKG